jgi:hypothetical protein
MSELGMPGAFLFVACCFAFVAAMIALDFWLGRKGSEYTITYGTRYLIRHCPLLTHLICFLLGLLLGGLFVHFAGAPYLWQP